MAWLNLNGVPYYKGTFDLTWPGQLVFHQIFISVLGVHSWTARAGDLIILQPAVLAIYYFLRRSGFPKAATAAALLYPFLYVTSGAWMAGHRDIVAAHFLIGAAVFALPKERSKGWRPIAAGLFIGYAVMIRPTYLAFAPILFVIALPEWRTREGPAEYIKQALRFGFGLSIPPLVFAIYGLATGTIHDWYVDAFLFVFDVYQVPLGRGRLIGLAAKFLVRSLWWPVIAGILGAFLWLRFCQKREGLWLLAGITITILISYFAQNKGFGYHLAGLIPVLLMLACAGVEVAYRTPFRANLARDGLAAAVAVLLGLGTTLRLAHAHSFVSDHDHQERDETLKLDDAIAFADIVRRESSPSDTFFQWGWQYQVSFLAQRRSPTKLVNTEAARQVQPGQPIFGKWLTEFDHDLTERPPLFILVDQTVIPVDTSKATKFTSPGANTMLGILKRRIANGYVVRDQRGQETLLKRGDCVEEPSVSGRRLTRLETQKASQTCV